MKLMEELALLKQKNKLDIQSVYDIADQRLE